MTVTRVSGKLEHGVGEDAQAWVGGLRQGSGHCSNCPIIYKCRKQPGSQSPVLGKPDGLGSLNTHAPAPHRLTVCCPTSAFHLWDTGSWGVLQRTCEV